MGLGNQLAESPQLIHTSDETQEDIRMDTRPRRSFSLNQEAAFQFLKFSHTRHLSDGCFTSLRVPFAMWLSVPN